jgi:ribonuclease HII
MLCGIDEAGRGPLAGPVCAAAVVLPDDFPADMLDDSKKLKPKQREAIRHVIVARATAWGVGWASHIEIDAINILQASLLAMRRAFYCLLAVDGEDRLREKAGPPFPEGAWPDKLEIESPFGLPFVSLPAGLTAVVDGLYAPDIPIPCTALVKADATVREVMAASILAKTARDQLMVYYGKRYPEYGYERHKGYPTKEHRGLILKYGPSPIQRMSFRVGLSEK